MESVYKRGSCHGIEFTVKSSGRDPTQFVLQSGIIWGGGTMFASKRILELEKIWGTERYRPRMFRACVREEGEGAKPISAALVKR